MPNILLLRGKYTTLSVIITILTVLSIFKLTNPAICVVFGFVYLLFFGFFLGIYFIPQEKKIWQILIGFLSLTSLITLLLTLIYWFSEINQYFLTVVLIFLPLIIGCQKIEDREDPLDDINDEIKSYINVKSHLATKLLAILAFFLDTILLFNLLEKQYKDTLLSPWTIIGPKFFLVFFLTTTIILWVTQKSKHNATNLLLVIIHFSLTLSTILIIFYYGYGFDPFIHQATEKWIALNGSILPKQPYYLGQYMLVNAGFFVTHLRLDIIDRILVPLGASILIPTFAYLALSKRQTPEKIFAAITLTPLIPLIFFTNTSPNNLAQLFALVLVFWIWYENYHSSHKTNLWGLILAVFICSIHPFIGLPMLTIYIGSIIYQKIKSQNYKIIFYSLYSLILTLILPVSFYLNSLRSDQKLFLFNPLKNLTGFFSMFSRPFYYWMDQGNFAWKTLYYYRDFILPLCLVIIIFGLVIVYKKNQKKLSIFFAISTLGLLFSSFFLATALKFPDVISYEQNVYAHRIFELSYIILIPFFIIAFHTLFLKIKKQHGKQFIITILLSSLLLISYYFTYPTRDPISHYTGFNLRQADINAVRSIAKRNNNKFDYIVLSNQAVATAALREFGFAKYFETAAGQQYFYSIPTGGPFYTYFKKMIYEEPKKQWMVEAMNFAGVKKAYFIHTNYWAPAAEIRDKAKLEADSWWEIEGGKTWVYEYLLNN